MTTRVAAALLTLFASRAFAQAPEPAPSLATPTGHEISAGVASYTYREPGGLAISIHGVKFVGEYTGARLLGQRRHWFAQAQVRGTVGSATYDGWCSPFVITPNSASPNGYALHIDGASATACSETGDRDWYVEGRALAGRDLVRQRWAWSPYSGIGLRHLSNGTNGTPGYRTDDYLYVPAGLTARTAVASHRVLSLNAEADVLVHGWQHTHDSRLGGGDVPATPVAPAFTIDGFTDIAFAQSRGWAVRASAAYPLTSRSSIEPYYVRWAIQSSTPNTETVTFTVNSVAARQQMAFYEPFNVTSEFGVRLGLRF